MNEKQGKSPEQLAAAKKLAETAQAVEDASSRMRASRGSNPETLFDLAEAYAKAVDAHNEAFDELERLV